jgi:hypothetical protein
MTQAGRRESEIAAYLAALEPVVRAVERAGTRIDAEIAWALLAVEADRQRRRAQHVRQRRSVIHYTGAGMSVALVIAAKGR